MHTYKNRIALLGLTSNLVTFFPSLPHPPHRHTFPEAPHDKSTFVLYLIFRYLKGIRKGETIHVKAEAVRAGKKFFICNADFIDEDGKLAARGSQTIYRTTPSSTSTKHKNLAAKL